MLQHTAKKELKKRRGRMFCFSIDLKAAFDKVNRRVLWREMERKGIKKGLDKVKEIYENTKNAIRTQESITEWFSISKEVRQRCPLSPLLFSIIISNIEKK